MLPHWHLLSDRPDPRRVNVGQNDSWPRLGQLGKHLAPRTDDQRMSEGRPSTRVRPDLGRRDEIALGFDRPRPEQHVPMRGPGGRREGCRNGQELGACVALERVELGEPDVVANAQANAETAHGACRRKLPRRRADGLAEARAVGQVDVEQVHLPVAGDEVAPGTDHDARVVRPGGVRRALRKATPQDPNAVRSRPVREGTRNGPLPHRLGQVRTSRLGAQVREALRQAHQRGSTSSRLGDVMRTRLEVLVEVFLATKLNSGDSHPGCHTTGERRNQMSRGRRRSSLDLGARAPRLSRFLRAF